MMFNNDFVKTCAIGIVGIAYFAGSGAARAQEVRLGYYAHELATAEGVRAVSNRIDKKVRRACARTSPMVPRSAVRACRTDLTSQLVGKINDPVLTAIYSGQKPDRIALTSRRDAR